MLSSQKGSSVPAAPAPIGDEHDELAALAAVSAIVACATMHNAMSKVLLRGILKNLSCRSMNKCPSVGRLYSEHHAKRGQHAGPTTSPPSGASCLIKTRQRGVKKQHVYKSRQTYA